jgi:hypothetical protein
MRDVRGVRDHRRGVGVPSRFANANDSERGAGLPAMPGVPTATGVLGGRAVAAGGAGAEQLPQLDALQPPPRETGREAIQMGGPRMGQGRRARHTLPARLSSAMLLRVPGVGRPPPPVRAAGAAGAAGSTAATRGAELTGGSGGGRVPQVASTARIVGEALVRSATPRMLQRALGLAVPSESTAKAKSPQQRNKQHFHHRGGGGGAGPGGKVAPARKGDRVSELRVGGGGSGLRGPPAPQAQAQAQAQARPNQVLPVLPGGVGVDVKK